MDVFLALLQKRLDAFNGRRVGLFIHQTALRVDGQQTQVLDPERSIRLQVPDGLTLLGDRDAFKQILLIALENAIKHSQGEISVTAELKQDAVEVRVQDRGQGIPADQLPHIFGRFYRAEGAETTPGFGLGLAIAKTLVERQSGSIAMKSAPGQGSTLVLRFPAL